MLLKAVRRHVLASSLLLHVAVGERLLGIHTNARHIARRHVALRHPGSARLGRQVSACWLFRRFDGISIVHTVVAGRGFRGVQASLTAMSVSRL